MIHKLSNILLIQKHQSSIYHPTHNPVHHSSPDTFNLSPKWQNKKPYYNLFKSYPFSISSTPTPIPNNNNPSFSQFSFLTSQPFYHTTHTNFNLTLILTKLNKMDVIKQHLILIDSYLNAL